MNGRYRWAPTPSGPLHVGNLFSMILTWLEARCSGAELLLRIDDLDLTRARREHVDGIFYVLRSLELDWDLGPQNAEEFVEKYSQAHSQSYYQEFFEEALSQVPELFFVCECSRKDLQGHEVYSGKCRSRNLSFEQDGSTVWRVRSDLLDAGVDREAVDLVGDGVLFRKEKLFAYQWVSLVEDLRWGVTDIIRGEDLYSSSAIQLALARTLFKKGLPRYEAFTQTRFHHHPLIYDQSKKLSKSEGAMAVQTWLDEKEKLLSSFLKWVGWGKLVQTQAPAHVKDLLELYAFEKQKGREIEISKKWQLNELLG